MTKQFEKLNNMEILAEMDKCESAANTLMSGTVSFEMHVLASPIMSRYHQLANELKTRTGIDVRQEA